ncbi:MAG: hypothetical protein ACXAC2_20735, partial [Candidatus Kariarchaeaceae archaeon]
ENQQTGFLFQNYLNEELLAAIIRASDCYFNNQQKWIEIQKNCMNQDFSWEKPAKKWEFLQLNLIRSMKGNNSS